MTLAYLLYQYVVDWATNIIDIILIVVHMYLNLTEQWTHRMQAWMLLMQGDSFTLKVSCQYRTVFGDVPVADEDIGTSITGPLTSLKPPSPW